MLNEFTRCSSIGLGISAFAPDQIWGLASSTEICPPHFNQLAAPSFISGAIAAIMQLVPF